ncbi:MAG TPA: hypothetical protein VFT46_12910, partial [Holophagaceae bacterium]|nr:hypothetical protein [Holophagaceae bacterium]
LAPDSWDIWLEYTSALRQAGQLQKAARAGWRAVELGPDRVESWVNLSNVLQMANALPEDAALLEEMARRFPGDAHVVKAFDILAYTAWSLRDFALARKALDRTLQLDPHNLVARMDQAGVALSAGAPGAKAQLEAALAEARKAGDDRAVGYAQQLLDGSKGGRLDPPYPQTWAAEVLAPALRTRPAAGAAAALPVADPAPQAYQLKRLGSLRLAVPLAWRRSVAGSEPAKGLANLAFGPATGAAFAVKVTALTLPDEHPQPLTPERAKAILAAQFGGAPGLQVHWLPEARGAMAWARDPAWKPGRPDDYPNLLTAVLQVGPATVTLSCFWGLESPEPPKAFLDLVSSLAWVPKD